MSNHDTKCKLIWAVTNSGIDAFGIENIGKTIHHNHLHAVRFTYSQEAKSKIKLLRNHLNELPTSKENQPSQGKVPFLMQFLGRRALVSVPERERTLNDGEVCEISFGVDSQFCASSPMIPACTQCLEIRVSDFDQIITLKQDSVLSFSYGAVECVIEKIQIDRDHKQATATAKVLHGGLLISGMDVCSSDMSMNLFPLLEEDQKTLEDKDFSALADYIIVHGIHTEEQFFSIKKAILQGDVSFSKRHPSVPISKEIREKETILPPRFLFKIDSKTSWDLYPKLLPHVEGIVLGRSELGLTVHPYQLPILQKQLIHECNKASKIVIIASELMHSMCKNSNPTRAEVSDLANAAADGADALSFSHAVTEGPHANLLARVSRETLLNSEAWAESKWHPYEMEHILSDDDAVTYGAIRIAEQAKVKAIVCFTEGGYTAMKLSSMSTPTQIIAITCNLKVMRQLTLLRSVECALLSSKLHMEKILQDTKQILTQNFHFQPGDKFVFVSLTASSVSARNSNLFTLQEID
jgi:pyruvate kinase